MSAGASAQEADLSRDAEARSLFEAGRTAFQAGRFEAALGHFRASYELSGRPELLFNIGSAADRLRLDDEALEAFEGYVERVPDAPNRAEVLARIEVLRRAGAGAEAVEPDGETTVEADALPPVRDPSAGEARRPAPLEEPSPEESDEDILSEWWLWAAIGAAVVIGTATAVFLAAGGENRQAPLPGDDGVVVMALEAW